MGRPLRRISKRNTGEALHQSQQIGLAPKLCNLAVFYAKDLNARHGYALAGGWQAHEIALVNASGCQLPRPEGRGL